MKYLEWLKQQLGEEQFNKHFPAGSDILKTVTEKLGEKKIIEDDGRLIPKSRFDEVDTKKKELETQLTAANDSLTKVQAEVETLKKGNNGEKDSLEKQLQALTEKLTALETESKNDKTQLQIGQKRSVVESALRQLKANENYLPTLLREFELKHPLDKLEIVDGKIKDAETIFKPFQDTYKPMFGEVVPVGFNPKNPAGNPGDFYSIEQMKTMPESEIMANLDKVNQSMEFHSKQGN